MKADEQVVKLLRSMAVAGLLGYASIGSAQSVQADPLGHRLKLSLFEYSGSEDGLPKIYFSQFKGILRDKLTVLVEELPDPNKEFVYLKRLTLEPPGKGGLADNLANEEAVQKYWDQSHSLLLFRGILASDTRDNYFAQSRIYLGTLQGALPHASVPVRLPIRSDEFPTTSDTHFLIVYYALAKDSIRMGDDKSRAIELLSFAQDKISDLRKQSALTPDLLEIDTDIKRIMASARSSHPSQ